MTDKASTRYTLASLRGKRARIAGENMALHQQITRNNKAIEHLDAVLAILDPNYRADSVKPIAVRRQIKIFKPGDLGRLIINLLRKSPNPLGTHDIAAALDLDGQYGTRKLSARVRANLEYLLKTERVHKISKGRSAKWCVVDKRAALKAA